MIHFLLKDNLPLLVDRLLQEYVVVAPVVRDQAIVFSEIASHQEMALGIRENKAPGRSTLKPCDDGTVFGHFNGANSVKGFLHPPHQPLFSGPSSRENGGVAEVPPEAVRMAFVGLRPCDAAAVGVLDRVFLGGPQDVHYQARRRESLIVAAHCTAFGATCFCTTVGTGPKAASGYDVALTELETGFLVETGTERGERIVRSLSLREARVEEMTAGEERIGRVAREMPVRFDRETVAADLWNDPDHPVWAETAARCLG
ncbi:MAG: sulfite reductase subunit A, partial [Chloroflexi bacterium]|nr:sulfite reductase subunit A [Chloroflexota bacterium]